jgi:predicted transcriptional regulator
MNKRLETVLDRVSTWPEEALEELIDHIIAIEAKHWGIYLLSDDERAAVKKGLEAAERGEVVSDEAAFFSGMVYEGPLHEKGLSPHAISNCSFASRA